ncbi:hypothetical protein [Alkaliphilus sp. B6464]|uniref:hypothetical protein n=1 Tax=Alkaliphilus sp. B6464 TaxID=2731219 RepID=UPI001BAABD8A|nr:hypothetical protein [Alkaliphilus sp. B6464]QUH21999.1 hypothetical protein HYG84_19025 [Alkaliphilus sp. B6464]
MVKINRKGGIGIILLFILMFMTAILSLFVFTETKTLDIKRRNIHNAALSANLALYDVVEQGDKNTMLNYRPDQLTSYITNPSTIPSDHRNNILNLLSAEYFPEGQRYKAVYLEKDKALARFKEYLKENLKLKEVGVNTFVPINDEKNYIKQIELKEFFVHNAVDIWDQDKSHPNNDIKNNPYTGVHVYIEATVYNGTKIYSFKGTTKVPIHLDTDITIFRSKQ